MSDSAPTAANQSSNRLSLPLLTVCLLVAIGGLIYVSASENSVPAAPSALDVVEGDLEVDYMIITSKTASSESSSGSTISAKRVAFFPSYVLVTTEANSSGETFTLMWPVDRLKRLEVKQKSAPASTD